jgi:hypothetical protein
MKLDGEKGAFGDVLVIHRRNTLQGIRNTVVAYPVHDLRSQIIIFGRFFLSQWTNSDFQDLRTAFG